MNEQTYICCHAPSLALLLFETACTSKNQKGLLLGTVKKHVEISTTDENEANEENKTVIYVDHCVPITDDSAFSPHGELQRILYDNYISKYKDRIVGWYTYRRNRKSTSCSLQEGLIHKSLLSNLENANRETFPLALLTATTLQTLSTHSFSQTFLRLNHRNTFEHIRLKIYNLSDKVASSTGYLRNMSFPVSQTFEKVTNSVNDERGVHWVKNIQSTMAEALAVLNMDLLKLENSRENLEAEVVAIRSRLKVETTIPDDYLPSPRKEKLTARFLKYDPEVRYGWNRVQSLMQVSDDDEEEEIEPKEQPDAAKVRELTASLLQTPAVRRLTETPQSYAAATGRRPSPTSGGGDAQSPISPNSNIMEH